MNCANFPSSNTGPAGPACLSRFILLFSLLLATPTLSPCFGQSPAVRSPVTADIKFLAPFVRSGAPIPISLDVTSDKMREVSFVFSVAAGRENFLDYRSDNRILGPGRQRFSMLLPSPRMPEGAYMSYAEITVSYAMDGRGAPVPLRTCPLPLPQADRFGQHMAVCTMHDPPSQAERDMALALTIPTSATRGLGDPAGRINSSAPILAWLDPDDLPIHAVHLCAYDVVCVLPGAFSKLREAQLRALGEWVRGGGNIVVILDQDPLKPAHAAFLNLLADTEEKRPWFTQAADGSVRRANIVPAKRTGFAAGFDGQNVFHTGVGRSVVMDALPNQDALQAGAWHDRKAFIWRVPSTMRKGVAETGAYRPPAGDRSDSETPANLPNAPRPAFPMDMSGLESGGDALAGILLRDVTTTVPGGILLLILTAFVLSVGPLQHRFLKRFNATRWTWVVFPLTAVLFTVLTIALANAWIGRNTRQRSLFVVDLGRRNEFLRCNRFDLFFSGRPVTTSSEGRYSILSSFAREGYPRVYTVGSGWSRNAVFTGAFPIHYQLEQEVAQWDPCIVRQLSFERPKDLPTVPWDLIDERKPPDDNLAPIPGATSWSYAVMKGGPNRNVHDDLSMHARSLSMAYAAGPHLLSLPHSPCGGSLNDLAVMNVADTTERLLVIVKEDERNTYIFRRPNHE